jgi:hypothetical protein
VEGSAADAASTAATADDIFEIVVGKIVSRAVLVARSIACGEFDQMGATRGLVLDAEMRGDLAGAVEVLALAHPVAGGDAHNSEDEWRRRVYDEGARRIDQVLGPV